MSSKCAPRLSAEAQEMLSSHFVGLRQQVQQVERDNDERSSIPITIRYESSLIFIFKTDQCLSDNLKPLFVYQNHWQK